MKQIFYSINKNEIILYTRKNLINNTNYFILIKPFKNKKNYLFYIYKKVIYIFYNIKILKNHMSKNRSRKRNRKKRR